MKKLIYKLLEYLDLKITRKSYFDELNKCAQNFEFLKAISPDCRKEVIQNFEESKSQLSQDLFVLSELGFKKNGFFVEFGAANGLDLSNTFLLETKFNWQGILAEPAKVWHEQLKKNRNVAIETDCVWKRTGDILSFNETQINQLSTLDHFSKLDLHKKERSNGNVYDVKTISLEDMLSKFKAPNVIDYLSIDTEGSEFEILDNFNFDRYKFKIITCEHNHTSDQNKIYNLLTNHGYQRKFVGLSRWDDWYVLSDY
tara:strand:+ start:168 stop:935 length:768 start_codon:yes stop_codon:yes gene_type:complete